MASFALPVILPTAAAVPATIKAALPALTVMMVNGALNFLYATLILIAGWMLARWVGSSVHNLLDRAKYIDETLKPLLAKFARYAVLAITVVAVLGQFGVQTTSLIALVGATGLALGLALQGTLANVASGVMLLILRPFKVTDSIAVGDAKGVVREISLFRTALVTDDGLYVSIPNSTIFSGTIINNSRETIRRANFTVDIDRGEDIGAGLNPVRELLEGDTRVLKPPKPDVQVDSLAGPAVTLSVRAWLRNANFGSQQSDLRKLVRQKLEEAHVSPPVPVPAPAVAPWTPPATTDAGTQPNKPN